MMTPLRSILLVSLLLGAGLTLRADDHPAAPPAAPATDNAPRYPLHGTIVGLFPDKGMLLIKHDEVPGLMKAMTIGFRVQPEVFKEVRKGETITATLVVREDDFYLENVKVVKR